MTEIEKCIEVLKETIDCPNMNCDTGYGNDPSVEFNNKLLEALYYALSILEKVRDGKLVEPYCDLGNASCELHSCKGCAHHKVAKPTPSITAEWLDKVLPVTSSKLRLNAREKFIWLSAVRDCREAMMKEGKYDL